MLPLLPSRATAAPTQEDVFKSIKANVDDSPDLSGFLPYAAAAVGLVVLLAVLSQRRKQEIRPRALNHQGRLTKEIMKTVSLKPAELRQLKLLADDAPLDTPLSNPLTLLLCPSVMARAIRARQARHAKIDRKLVSSVARKAGVTREMLTRGGS